MINFVFFFCICCIFLVFTAYCSSSYFSITYVQVEHLIREEKMVAAYDLIELYCELIAARLPIIESQKYVKFHYFRWYCTSFYPFMDNSYFRNANFLLRCNFPKRLTIFMKLEKSKVIVHKPLMETFLPFYFCESSGRCFCPWVIGCEENQ